MANGPQPGPPGALREAAVRGLAILASLLLGAGVVLARVFSRAPSSLATDVVFFLALYLALTAFLWGLNGFAFRRLPLSGIPLFLFSAALFGVFFLLGYFVGAVAGPFLGDAASRIIPYVHIADAAFLLFAVMTIAGAAGTAFSRNIIYSAWSLLFAFLGVAGLYVFLGGDFPAVAEGLIYVGGVLVLILFAIMLTKQIGEDPKLTNAHLQLPAGAALAAITVATLTYMAFMAPWKTVESPSYDPSSAGLGVAFLTDFLLPFEFASVVLLAALVGAVVIARKEIKKTSQTVP